ncbi:hypothetical protein IRZ71_06615 [Flavobacterium sp. ANB]|nr:MULTISPECIES: hypothetical protein [unclassified Flavobacterium]MBF4516005.1 hypothetical protein [Flavobacterium sp. ANB]MTD69007.1 hypothetical protein [Flavobacterium sp. LC2016-13]
MNNMTNNLKILIVGLTTVLALTNSNDSNFKNSKARLSISIDFNNN